jgi:sugar phosphate permease
MIVEMDTGADKPVSLVTLRKRWIVWTSLVLVYLLSHFHRVAPAVIAEDLMRTFHTTGTLLGGLASTYFYTYAIMQIPAGILSDTLGGRTTITIGSIVTAVGTILFGAAPTLGLCYAGRLLIGLGVSVMMVNIMRICVEWFRPNELGFMAGLTTMVGGLGGLFAATPLSFLASGLGWRMSFVLIGIVSMSLAVLCWKVVRNRPQDCGLPPLTGGAGPPEESQVLGLRASGIVQDMKIVLKNPYTWPPFFSFFAIYSTLMSFLGLWGIPFLTQIYGLSNQTAANHMMVISLGLIVGGPVTGHLSDRILSRRRMPYVLYTFFYCLIWAVICFVGSGRPPAPLLYPICFLMGFFSSTFVLTLICSKEVNPPRVAGVSMGTVNAGGFLGGAVFQVLLGKILDSKWEQALVNGVRVYPLEAYRLAFLVCFGATLMGLAAALLIKETRCQNIRSPSR